MADASLAQSLECNQRQCNDVALSPSRAVAATVVSADAFLAASNPPTRKGHDVTSLIGRDIILTSKSWRIDTILCFDNRQPTFLTVQDRDARA
jgi:hypothetical protein